MSRHALGEDETLQMPPKSSRRGFLGIVAGLIGAMAAMLGVPLAGLFAAPILRRSRDAGNGNWVPIGSAAGFGDVRKEVTYAYQQEDGWYTASRTRRVLVGKHQDGFVVVSTKCTHLGCGVTWRPADKTFYCPCHAGVYNEDGKPFAGPPEKPLTRLQSRVNEQTGQLEVLEG